MKEWFSSVFHRYDFHDLTLTHMVVINFENIPKLNKRLLILIEIYFYRLALNLIIILI